MQIRRWHRWLALFSARKLLALLVCCVCPIGSSSLLADSPVGQEEVHYFNQRIFKIPFQADRNNTQIKQLVLYVSDDNAARWRPVGTVNPDAGFFIYESRSDGYFLFSVQTVDVQGRRFPPSETNMKVQMRVVVDTQPPQVAVRATQQPSGGIVADWRISDPNLALETFRLDYRAGGAGWVPLALTRPRDVDSFTFTPTGLGVVEVRLQVADKAKNIADVVGSTTGATTNLAGNLSGNQAGAFTPNDYTHGAGGAGFNPDRVVITNGQDINLKYDVHELGTSGVSKVEVWARQLDPKGWQILGEQGVNKKEAPFPPVNVKLGPEGLYGFVILAKSGVGLGEPPPNQNTIPQIWVHVDRTKPTLNLLTAEVRRDRDQDHLMVTYSANDKNFDRRPIMIYYSAVEQPGQWLPLTTEPQENTGRFVWAIPNKQSFPSKIMVRVEAKDKAGNAAVVDSRQEIIIDTSIPRAALIGVEPNRGPLP